jgi:hypothetical protein
VRDVVVLRQLAMQGDDVDSGDVSTCAMREGGHVGSLRTASFWIY